MASIPEQSCTSPRRGMTKFDDRLCLGLEFNLRLELEVWDRRQEELSQLWLLP